MKLGPITIGGRRDGSGYQHSTASIVITPDETDTAEDCMAKATELLAAAFAAAEAGVESRGSTRASVPTPAPKAAPAPARNAPPLQSFPATEVGKLAKDMVKKVDPAAKTTAPTPKADPSTPPASAPSTDADGLKRRVNAWRKLLAEKEISEGAFLKACEVNTAEELPQLKTFGITSKQLNVFVDDVAKILANADDVPM